MARLELLDGASGPRRPMAQQAADDPLLDRCSVDDEPEGGQEVRQDVVVIARVEGDVVAARGLHHRADDVLRLVPVERRHLDGLDALDVRHLPPKVVPEEATADARLQIEPEDRDDLAHPRDVGNKLLVRPVTQTAQADKRQIVPEPGGNLRFGDRLLRRTNHTTDHDRPVR